MTVSGHCFHPLTADAIGEAAEGVYRSINWNETIDTPEAMEFTARYKESFPDTFMLYDSWERLRGHQGLGRRGRRKRERWRVEALVKAMEGLELDSPTGPIQVREDHHVNMPMHLMQVQDGSSW